MAIPEDFKNRFDLLLEAVQDGALALVECSRRSTGEPVYAVAIVGRSTDAEDADYILLPVAVMLSADGPDFADLEPPEPDSTIQIEPSGQYPT